MIYMFNELSLTQVNSIADARNVLETFIKSSIRAKDYGFTEIRLHENSLQNLYQISLHQDYRIDNWFNDAQVNADLKILFKEIVANPPLITNTEIEQNELYERSEFYKVIDGNKAQVFGLGAAYVFGTLAISLSTNAEWLKSLVSIQHYSINHDGIENNNNDVNVRNFSTLNVLESHKKWIENEQRESLEKSIDLWNRREELLPNISLGSDLENQLQRIGLTKKFSQVFYCLKKLDSFANGWLHGGFNLTTFKAGTLLDVSCESECTMRRYFALRKFRLSDGKKVQFELHIKIPDVRIYFLPDEVTHKITVGYIGKHLKTCLYD